MITEPIQTSNGLTYHVEVSNEPVHFCMRIRLSNGATVLYDDHRGVAEGSDGRKYYAILREPDSPMGDIEILGWSAEVDEETVVL